MEYVRSQVSRVRTVLTSYAPTVPDIENAIIIQNNEPDQPEFSVSVLGFCFASVLGLLVLYFEISSNKQEMPMSLHLFALSMTCSFVAIFIAQFVGRNLGKLLRRIGYVFAALAFFVAVIIPSPVWLRIMYCLVFVIGSLIFFIYGHI